MSVSWTVVNESSFASIRVQLPIDSRLNTESDAVISMSEGITVCGRMSGGILGSMLRSLVSDESFFTTMIENPTSRIGDALLAPSEPGGVCLHRLYGPEDSMMLTSGSYLASDTSIEIKTVVQRRIQNSLLSGTGFFLMKASGRGMLAISSYGSIHKYTLLNGERRLVDNGHLVAWTASMGLITKMASSSVWGSVSSGEGLMCEFTGPGVIYLQSHKSILKDGDNSKTNSPGIAFFIVFLFLMLFLIITFIFIFKDTMKFDHQNSNSPRGYSIGEF